VLLVSKLVTLTVGEQAGEQAVEPKQLVSKLVTQAIGEQADVPSSW
jgi:hypothetical protein